MAGPINIGCVVKHNGHERQSKSGKTSDFVHSRYVAVGLFNGKRNKSFDVGSPERRSNGNNLNLIVGNVGNSVNRQFGHFVGAVTEESDDKQPDDEFIPDGKRND